MKNPKHTPTSDTPHLEEDDKTSEGFSHFYTRYTKPVKEHVNPLLHNKGSVNFVKDNPTPPPKLDLSPLVLTTSPHLTKKSESAVIQFDSMLSLDCSPTGMSEFYSAEKAAPLNSVFQLPLFEIHHTMYLLAQKRDALKEIVEEKNDVAEEEAPSAKKPAPDQSEDLKQKKILKMPYKSCSMQQAKCEGIETMAADLTPRQYGFLKKVFAYKSNYLFHTLNFREVYFQYVAVTKEIMKLSTSEDVAEQLQTLMRQSKSYAKKPREKCKLVFLVTQPLKKGKKTLVLDLDETLLHAEGTPAKGYDHTFTYVEDDGNRRRVSILL